MPKFKNYKSFSPIWGKQLGTVTQEARSLEVQVKGSSTLIAPKSLTARGQHQESKLRLYIVSYQDSMQTSVFIYPSDYILTPSNIPSLDGGFTKVLDMVVEREFKDASMEDVSAALLREAKPLIPFMSHTYPIHRSYILEHSFQHGSHVYLKDIIESLKP